MPKCWESYWICILYSKLSYTCGERWTQCSPPQTRHFILSSLASQCFASRRQEAFLRMPGMVAISFTVLNSRRRYSSLISLMSSLQNSFLHSVTRLMKQSSLSHPIIGGAACNCSLKFASELLHILLFIPLLCIALQSLHRFAVLHSALYLLLFLWVPFILYTPWALF